MIVEIVAVGTELLLGQTVNTNCAYLGARLAELGHDAHYQTVVGDNLERMTEAIRTAAARADAVLITGGLGPTPDDATREAICAAAGLEMVYDREYAADLEARWRRRGLSLPDNNLRQAEHPQGARLLPNPRGTAPGLVLRSLGALIIALPGVPAEMHRMFQDHVAAALAEESGESEVLVSRMLRTWGRGESAVAEILDDIYHRGVNPSLAYLASAGEVKVRISAKAPNEEQARAMIDPVEEEVRQRLGSSVFAADEQTIEGVIMEELTRRGWTIGAAESMTSGMVAARLSMVPGASAVFRGGVAAYHPQVKTGALGVPAALLEEHGAVSAETARAMAEGAARLLGAEAAVAVTGSAGPEPLERPPGAAFIAVRTPEGERVKMLRLPGDRERVRAYATTAALQLTRLALIGEWWRSDG